LASWITFIALALASGLMYSRDRRLFQERTAINYWNLGEIAFKAGDYHQAHAAYKQAWQLAPHTMRPLLGVCKLLAVRKDWNKVLHLFETFYPAMEEDLRREFLREEVLLPVRQQMLRIVEHFSACQSEAHQSAERVNETQQIPAN